jgi:hypothetical protein
VKRCVGGKVAFLASDVPEWLCSALKGTEFEIEGGNKGMAADPRR